MKGAVVSQPKSDNGRQDRKSRENKRDDDV